MKPQTNYPPNKQANSTSSIAGPRCSGFLANDIDVRGMLRQIAIHMRALKLNFVSSFLSIRLKTLYSEASLPQ